MKDNYDLTNDKVLAATISYITSPNIIVKNIELLRLVAWSLLSPPQKNKLMIQKEVAKELIKQGEKSGIKKLKIKLSNNNNTGFSFNTPIKGMSLSVQYAPDNTIEVEAEYKD